MAITTTSPTGYEVRRLSAALGAEIIGIDLRQPLDAATVAALRRTWLENQVLLFRGQEFGAAEQIRFSEYFGPVDDYPLVHFRHPDNAKLMLLTNAPVKGTTSTSRNAGARWHTDLSFTARPATASLLHAQRIPEIGGDTMFANQYLAFDKLSPLLREIIEPLHAVHELFSGRSEPLDARMLEMKAVHPRVAHAMVRIHPETRRPALYVNPSITTEIVGLTREESAGLLDFLRGHSVREEFLYRHVWRKGDFIMWDNRCLLHMAVQDYGNDQVRLMHRTTITGEPCGRVIEQPGGAKPQGAAQPASQSAAQPALDDAAQRVVNDNS